MDVTDEDFRALADRARAESDGAAVCEELLGTVGVEELADVLVAPEQPLWAREIAAFRLGRAGDTRAFEALVLLLNHRDAERRVAASYALVGLGDPRTARAAAALATNRLRTAYAAQAVRLLTALRAPESAPALITTLEGLLAPEGPHAHVALACVEGLGELADRRAVPVLRAAVAHPRLSDAATRALNSLA